MKITIIGSGYVGLVSGACFAEFGTKVTCVDVDEEKIQILNSGDVPIYETGLRGIIARQVEAGRLSFTSDLASAMKDADAVFIAVGTPMDEKTGHADLKYVHAAALEVAKNLPKEKYVLIVTKSTVPVGTAAQIKKIILSERPDAKFDVASNPEFLREGSAINDFMRPDRVVIGVDSDAAKLLMENLYRPLYLNDTPIIVTTPQSAEQIKYAANAFLATKITFINEMADLCEKTGADIKDVARGMGLDKRIGSRFLRAGAGYGGSCFPKDTLALTGMGRETGARQSVVEAVVASNDARQKSMAQRVINACNGSVDGLKIGILGVSFKPNTDDIRYSPALQIIEILQKSGAKIDAFDPEALDNAKRELRNVSWSNNPYDVALGAHAIVVVTEWNEFRTLDLAKIGKLMTTKRLIDLRNIYRPQDATALGFEYTSIGR